MQRLLHSNNLSGPNPTAAHPRAEDKTPLGAALASRRASAVIFSPWQNERAAIVIRVCRSLLFHVEQGHGLVKSSGRIARRYDGRKLKCDPRKQLRLSAKTIMRLFYRWQATGRDASALALGYRPGKKPMSAARLRRFVRASLAPAVSSYHLAHLRCGDSRVTASAYAHALPGSVKKLLRALFAQRRQANRTAQALKGVSI